MGREKWSLKENGGVWGWMRKEPRAVENQGLERAHLEGLGGLLLT